MFLHHKADRIDILSGLFEIHFLLFCFILQILFSILCILNLKARYPQDKWLHIFTAGSQIDGYINAGAGIKMFVSSDVFSWSALKYYLKNRLISVL